MLSKVTNKNRFFKFILYELNNVPANQSGSFINPTFMSQQCENEITREMNQIKK